MQLHDITTGIAKFKKRKRIGRGKGSGHGKTATKGHKGHSSRQGFKHAPLGEGGQMRMYMRIPKRGFSNRPFESVYAVINVEELEAFDPGTTVNEELLRAVGLVKGDSGAGVKILGDGPLTKSLTVEAQKFSKSARQKIEAAGGKIVEIQGPYQGR